MGHLSFKIGRRVEVMRICYSPASKLIWVAFEKGCEVEAARVQFVVFEGRCLGEGNEASKCQ